VRQLFCFFLREQVHDPSVLWQDITSMFVT
jgi:hypothetical protein